MTTEKETLGFQTEVKQLLHLVIHSLYSNKEIFLRELISNASDALDKLRFLALSQKKLYENDSSLSISIDFNHEAKTLTISDNGIGMSKEDIIDNLGTIAKSGTKEFLNQLTGDEVKDSHLIGQFGVGFYSAFIVADKVTVKSRKAGSLVNEGVMWESDGAGEYSISQIDKEKRGTQITLHLKKEEEDFLNDWRIKSIITKYSDHISWPILMKKAKEEGDEKNEQEFETVNKATALWTLQKNEVKDDEYKELYKHISHDFQEPLNWSHNHVEGKQEYISLLYIPSQAPFDMWNQEVKHGLKLYVKRVFIMDDAEQLLPRYLRFIKGVVDSNDLPLNVSREILQDNKFIDNIRTACTKRILSMLEKMSKNDVDNYKTFWTQFGLVLKEGIIEDFSNKESIAKLLRFSSTQDDEQNVSLNDYVSRMKENQDKIYYICASSHNAAKNSPHLEIFKKKGIEVLLFSDRIDEWLANHLTEFDGKSLQSITKGKLDLGQTDEETNPEEQKKEFDSMLKQIKQVLGELVKDVHLTNRLTDSPACIVADDNDMGLEMQRILQSAGQDVPQIKPIFELNPEHELIRRLHSQADDELFKEWTLLLFEQAILAEGGQLEEPASFVARVNKLLVG
jgi:molecular chaperone HtpG